MASIELHHKVGFAADVDSCQVTLELAAQPKVEVEASIEVCSGVNGRSHVLSELLHIQRSLA